ncbi:putative disease resistance protein RGA1 [Triticum urartu]|uniref:putative disease resistance protein RGA1 n=1 Tax=Triticum urartu TaxID=4572 RepID=UPI002042C26D|nr:putative disease resistance protein RGA1 [Triticum urartu]
MAELGGMLAAAILKVVGEQIGSVIGGQIALKMNFDEDLNKMKMELEGVDALLEDAERRSITDRSTRLWLKRLKDFMYEISDMIDEFEADTQAIIQPSARKSSFKNYLATMISCLTIGPEITMANKMDKMRHGLEVITDQHRKFELMEGYDEDDVATTVDSVLPVEDPARIGLHPEERKEMVRHVVHRRTAATAVRPWKGPIPKVIFRATALIRSWSLLTPMEAREHLVTGSICWEMVARDIFNRFGCQPVVASFSG